MTSEGGEQSTDGFVLRRSADVPDFAHRLQCPRRGNALYQFLGTSELRGKERGFNEEVERDRHADLRPLRVKYRQKGNLRAGRFVRHECCQRVTDAKMCHPSKDALEKVIGYRMNNAVQLTGRREGAVPRRGGYS